jgi:hypothetical protein
MSNQSDDIQSDNPFATKDEVAEEADNTSAPSSMDNLLFPEDDVFVSNPVKMTGVEDYNALRETLSWTQSAQFWPNIEQTDWVVLSGNATLASDQNVVAVVKDADTTITVTSGNNMIFADTSSLTINQNGGQSELYYDPNKDIELNVNVYEGLASVSQLTPNFTNTADVENADGSRTISSNKAKINYNTAENANVYLNDVMTGQVTRAVSTNTLSSKEIIQIDPIEDQVQPTPVSTYHGASDEVPIATQTYDVLNFVPVSKDIVFEDVSSTPDEIDELNTLFDDDVLIDTDMTDVVQDYLSEPIIEDWQLRSENYFSVSNDIVELAFTKEADQVQVSEENQEFSQNNEDTLDEVLAMGSWDDLIADDLLDLFYGE